MDYLVGFSLNVTALAKVNIEEYYLAANSNPSIWVSYIYPIGYSWLRIRPLYTSNGSTQPCLIHT
eukprot:4322704-Pleurochrysis_carterae.AAC.5